MNPDTLIQFRFALQCALDAGKDDPIAGPESQVALVGLRALDERDKCIMALQAAQHDLLCENPDSCGQVHNAHDLCRVALAYALSDEGSPAKRLIICPDGIQ